jgi:trehalose 6-phosphate synthase
VETGTAELGATLVVPAAGEARNAALGALSEADAVLINSTYDGFNLVAKEAALLGERAAVLLSRNAGAYEYLAPGVLPIEPFDVTGTADALEQVLVGGAGADRDGVTAVREEIRLDSAAGWLAAVIGEEPPDAR